MLSVPLISTLYQYGRFTLDDVLQTRLALLGYSVGLLGLILVKIVITSYSIHYTKLYDSRVCLARSTILAATRPAITSRILRTCGSFWR